MVGPCLPTLWQLKRKFTKLGFIAPLINSNQFYKFPGNVVALSVFVSLPHDCGRGLRVRIPACNALSFIRCAFGIDCFEHHRE
jgi:hypothetical protein